MKFFLLRFLTLCLISLGPHAYGQTFKPIFEDAEGKSAIIAPLGFFGVNTENSTIRFQYFYARSASQESFNAQLKRNRFYWGINVAGSAEGGISNLFSNGNFTPGTSASLFLGHRSLFFPALSKVGEPVLHGRNQIAIEDWLTLRVGGQAASYRIYDAYRPFENQVFRESFRGHLIQLAYNILIGGATSIGASWDVEKVNNINALAPVKFTQQTVVQSPGGQTTRIFEQEVNAYSGAFETFIANTYSLDAVHYVTPASEINYALHLYGRLQRADDTSVYRAGFGFYLFPKSKIAGGVFVESSDLTNKVSATPEFAKRIDIGLTVKYVLPTLGVPSP